MNDRKVHFSVPIHKIEYLDNQWETASRQARDGSSWIRIGLDRERFKNRIERTSEILTKIFDLDFRQQVYQERFENFVIPEPETIKLSTSVEPKTTAVATSTSSRDQSTQQTKHNNNKKKKKRRRKNYHSKHRGRH